jgi:excisionase family DNA binding protein
MRPLLTLKEVAATLNVSYLRAAELTREGMLPCVRIGRQVRVRPEDLERFVAEGGCPLPGGWRRRGPNH